MNALRDTMIAMIFVSMLSLMALKLSSNTKEHVITTRQSLETQRNIHLITDIIENDFRKIGHGLNNPLGAIALAKNSRIIFAYDQDPSSNFDSIRVEYYTRKASATPNPNDKLIYRKINNTKAQAAALGITKFKLKYFNGFGNQLPTPVCADSLPKIREIEVTIDLQNTRGFKNDYGGAKYKSRIIPKNLLVQYQ